MQGFEEVVSIRGVKHRLEPMRGDDLNWWLTVQARCSLAKARFLTGEIRRPMNENDLLQFQTAAVLLVMKAIGCSAEYAVSLDDETERKPIIQAQDRANGIDQAVNQIFHVPYNRLDRVTLGGR